MAELKARDPQKNISVPLAETGRARATEVFPPELLSPDKSKAGVVRIAKPDYLQGKMP